MDLSGYFQIIIGVLMTTTLVTIGLILLRAYYGDDEKESED
jgi:hypothetical protein